MIQSTFVNREKELAFFANDLRKERRFSRVVVLAGNSGIGKSALARQVISRNSDFTAVKIRVPASPSSQFWEGYYLTRIATEFDRCGDYTEGFPRLSDFLSTKSGWNLARTMASSFFDEIADKLPIPGLKTTKLAANQLLGKSGVDPDVLLSTNHADKTVVLKEYIDHVLERIPVVLNIENIQFVDNPSLDLLVNSAQRSPNLYLIVEFTKDTQGAWGYTQLLEYFRERGLDVSCIDLKQLPFAEYMRLFSADEGHVRQLLERTYLETGGNLRSLLDLNVQMEFGVDLDNLGMADPKPGKPNQATCNNILALERFDLMVLVSVAVIGARVPMDVLRELYLADTLLDTAGDIDSSIRTLSDRWLLEIDGDRLNIGHDQVAFTVFTEPHLRKFVLLAQDLWIKHYESLSQAGRHPVLSETDILSVLLNLYAQKKEYAKLYARLDYIKQIAVDSLFPKQAAAYLRAIRKGLGERSAGVAREVTVKVESTLIDVYFFSGLFIEALEILDDGNISGPKAIVYRAVLFDRLDRHQEAIEYCARELASGNYAPNLIVGISLKLVMLSSYRSVNNLSSARRVFEELISDRKFAPLDEYGYVLRNSEIVLSFSESIRYLEQSVTFFKEKGNDIAEAHSLISLAMQVARLGDLVRANECLDQAESLLRHKSLERHVILADRAVVNMYAGLYDESTVALLRRASYTANTSFDRLAIHNNLMCYAILSQDYTTALDELSLLERMLFEEGNPDRAVHRTVFYNASVLNFQAGDEAASARYLNLARDTLPEHNGYWRVRLFDEESDDRNSKFLLQHSLHLSFISFWHFEVNPALDSCG